MSGLNIAKRLVTLEAVCKYFVCMISNYVKVSIFQILPSSLIEMLNRFKNLSKTQKAGFEPIVRGIEHFITDPSPKSRALLILSPKAWITAIEETPNISFFNYTGLTFEIVKSLNENGLSVDVIDFKDPVSSYGNSAEDLTKYNLVVAHGGHCKELLRHLPSSVPVLQYVAGAYWPVFNIETGERYENFSKRNEIIELLSFRRSLAGIVDGERWLTERANFLFSVDLPRMVASFGEHQSKFFKTGLGAYLDRKLSCDKERRDFENGRRNFIYVGGTGGNIQKGLDVLLEAFSQTPDLNLYIYCKVEPEIIRYCRSFLNRPNVHYIYHWSRGARGAAKLAKLIPKVAFSVHAPINTGLGTAYMASIGSGLIPVGYVDLPSDDSWTVLSDSWEPEDLADSLRKASEKSISWCESASEKAVLTHKKNWSSEAFHSRFVKLIMLADKGRVLEEEILLR
ncbi:hypothetical protein N9908_04930 [Akkermansiaceae bacterium]|nr:hypothetical protein [Akkermansiaceae bacterium]